MTQLWVFQQWIVAGFLVVTCLIEVSNWFVLRRLEDSPALVLVPRVSVLIPARNEERSIERCIVSLLAQDYTDFEVLVLDDESTDATRAILSRLAASDRRLHVLEGQPLPTGWMGKQWACQQLLEKASGEYVLYVDADTWHHPAAVRDGASAMIAGQLDLLSAIPHEVTGTFGELLTVPEGIWALFAVLPLWLAFHTKTPFLVSANGQYMMFRTSSLKRISGFERVRSNAIDDLALARLVKASGMKWRLMDGTGRVNCRMYEGLHECVEGYSKNTYAVFYHNPLLTASICLLVLMVHTLPVAVLLTAVCGVKYPVASIWTAAGSVALSVVQWGALAVRFRFSLNLCWSWLIGQPFYVFIAFRSMVKTTTHRATWKGRTIRSTQRPPN